MTERDKQQPVSFEEMAVTVRNYLGSNLASLISFGNPDLSPDEQDIKPVDFSRLVEGYLKPTAQIQRRVKNTFDVISELLDAGEDENIIKDWFMRMNVELDDRAPAGVIVTDPQAVKSAANYFTREG